MDEFEKIRAFSEQMSQKTEEALRQENNALESHQAEEVAQENNPDFLREWSNQEEEKSFPKKNLNKTFWSVLVLAGMVFIALLVVVYLLLKSSMDNNETVPTIPPTPTPVKVKPQNPGGMVIPDQDKVIYDRISQDPVPVKVEKLFPNEEPVLPPIEEENTEQIISDEIEEISVIVETVMEEPTVEQKPAEVVKKEPEKIETKEVKAVTPKETKPVAPKEVWHAQLFSSTDKAKVERTWKTILAKHKGLLSDMPMNVVQAKIAGKGTFYRLQVGDFSTKERAANLCAKLKAKKQDCIPAK